MNNRLCPICISERVIKIQVKIYKCPYCNEEVIASEAVLFNKSTRRGHPECLVKYKAQNEKRAMQIKQDKNLLAAKSDEEAKAIILARKEAESRFSSYVCKLFDLRAPGPIIYAQRTKYAREYGLSDDDLIFTLRYIYEILKMPVPLDFMKRNIGLIPYYYEKAKYYIDNLQKEQQQLTADFMKLAKDPYESNTLKVNTLKQIAPKETSQINLESLLD